MQVKVKATNVVKKKTTNVFKRNTKEATNANKAKKPLVPNQYRNVLVAVGKTHRYGNNLKDWAILSQVA
jgi:hypothetical protein